MTRKLPNLIRNDWRPVVGGPMQTARILEHYTSPEGLEVERVRFIDAGSFSLDSATGHILSVIRGTVTLQSDRSEFPELHLSVTTHTYVPPDWYGHVHAPAGAEILRVSGRDASQARGDRLLVRDEAFLAACATEAQSLRWMLTSQYLSRRIFLHGDATLLSKSGHPVSWFRTTMFDVAGLPLNDDGEPVFKMQYDSRTEFNVCYDVSGRARVRLAQHPYVGIGQAWGPWHRIDGESTYHLNEVAGGKDEERQLDPTTGQERTVRNKHEVHVEDGHVTLFCLFDPAPAGFESHRQGEYSDYAPAPVIRSERHAQYASHLARLDAMVDELSLAQARGEVDSLRGSRLWLEYVRGRRAQLAHESSLLELLASQGGGRDEVVAPWTTSTVG